MATLGDKTFAVSFSNLASTGITSVVFIAIGLLLQDTLKRLRRSPALDADEARRRAAGEQVRERGPIEAFAMGYLWRAREDLGAASANPPCSSRPLAWIWDAIKTREHQILVNSGADAAAYVRLLRGFFYWSGLLSGTLFPLLLGINLHFSPSTLSPQSIDKASITSLIETPEGTSLLWIHLASLYYATLTFWAMLAWVGVGIVRNRREGLRALGAESVEPINSEAQGELDKGWRFRTVLVRNLPEALRSEEGVSAFFHQRLRVSDPDSKVDGSTSLIANIILVRRYQPVNTQYKKRTAVQGDLESAHTRLVLNVMQFVREKVELETCPAKQSTWSRLARRPLVVAGESDVEREAKEGDDLLVSTLRGYLPGGSPPLDKKSQAESIWVTLHTLPRHLLDRFQPLIKLKHFRGQRIPALDYHLSKLNLLTALIEDHRAHPESFKPSASAFVTFTSVVDARRAIKEVGKSRLALSKRGERKQGHLVECRVEMAPEVRDLIWDRLVVVSLSGDILRGILFQSLIWIATLVYLVPISFALSLISVTSISKFVPQLANYLNNHAVVKSLVSNLIPTAVVALLGMLTPTLIGILTRNGEVFYTTSSLHAAIQARYWKWLVVNILIVFVVGLAAFSAFLNLFQNPASLLTVIAGSFPKGATFFVSWSLLVVGVQSGIEIALLGIPYINHGSIRKMLSPRERASEDGAWSRSFLAYYWLPNHLLVIAVSAIFAILNPLVIPFNFAYFGLSLVVFTNQFSHVFWRRWYELQGRVIFRRAFRYSLDMFILAQFIALSFFEVSQQHGIGAGVIPLIPLTAIFKLLGTRYFDALMGELDVLEADLVCGEVEVVKEEEPAHAREHSFSGAVVALSTFATVTLPALALHPREPLPSAASRFGPQARTRSATTTTMPTTPRGTVFSRLAGTEERAMSGSTSEKETKNDSNSTLRLPTMLVTAHAPFERDDRPVSHLKYDNPAMVAPLETSLWLPRDPLWPVDLGDTIDFHGTALVSSEGGRGIIGSWFEEEDEKEAATGMERIRVAEDVESRTAEEARAESPLRMALRRRGSSRLSRTSARFGNTPPIINGSATLPTIHTSARESAFPFPADSLGRRAASEPIDQAGQASSPQLSPPPLAQRLSSTNSVLSHSSNLSPRPKRHSRINDPSVSISQASALRQELIIEQEEAEKEQQQRSEKQQRRELDERAELHDAGPEGTGGRIWFSRLLRRAANSEVDD